MFRRVLSLILSLCVLMTSMPTWSIAAALAENDEVIVEVIAEEPAKEEEKEEPTPEPTKEPTPEPTKEPTPEPTKEPTPEPAEEPVVEEPVVEEPVVEEPVVEEPVAEEPVVEEPVAEEPAVEEPVTEEETAPETEEPEVPAVPEVEAPVVPEVEETEETEEPEIEEPVFEDVFFTEPRFVDGYAYVAADEDVYADDELTEVLGAFAEKTVVYVSDREETVDEDQDVLTLRFACEDELVKAYIAAKNVQPLSDEKAADYEDEAADGVHYKDDVYLLNAEFVYDEEPTEGPEVNEEPVKPEEPVVEEPEEEEEDEEPAEVKKPVIVDVVVAPDADEEESEDSAEPETETEILEKPVATENAKKSEIVGQITIKATCAHENKKYTGDMYEVVEGTELTYDENGHTGTFNVTTFYDCLDCGEKLRPEEILTGKYNHQYVDMVCYVCGYKAQCTHNPEPQEMPNYWTDGATDNGDGTHTVQVSLDKMVYCSICDVVISSEEIEAKEPVTELHQFMADGFCGVCGKAADAMSAPYIDPETMSQPGDKQVTFSWSGAAENYKVYEALAEGDKVVATVSANTVTLKNVALGEHTYYVKPYDAASGAEGDASNYVIWRVDSVAWKKAPVIKTGKQATDVEGVVELVWTHGERAEYYVVYDGETAILATTDLSVTLENVEPGKHSYTVVPMQHDYRGNEIAGTKSKAKAVTVAELWNKKPTLSSAKQDTTGAGEGLVLLTFKPGKGALTHAYAILDKFGGETYLVGIVESDEASVTYMVEGAEAGSHVYSVAPVKVDGNGIVTDDTGMPVMGTASGTKTAKVAALWNKKGTLSVAKQLDDEEGHVQLTWKSGSALTQAWQIFDKFSGSTIPMNVVVSSDPTVTYDIYGLPAGSHVFSVKPVEVDENGVVNGDDYMPVTGVASGTKTVKVAEFWVKAPTITAVAQTGANVSDEVAAKAKVEWTAGSALTQAFAVYGTFNKVKNLLAVVVGATSAEVELSDVGSWSFTVAPVKLDENGEYDLGNLKLGTASKAKTLKATASTWADAPILKGVQKVDNTEGEVLLSWTQIVEADGFKVYEVINKKNVPVDGDETEPTVQAGSMECVLEDVAAGKHTYVVKPMRYDENEGWTFLTTGGASSKASNSVTVTVTEQWSLKPVIDEAEQEIEADNVVFLEWTPGSPLTQAFEVFDNGKQILDENGNPLIVFDSYVLISGVAVGSHKYTVKPVKLAYDGETVEAYGTASAAKTVKVAALWNAKPTIKSAVQLTDAEGTVKLIFSSKAKIFERFEIRNKFAGETYAVEPDEIKYNLEEGLVTVVISGLEKGSNSFTVVPMHYDSDTDEYEYGLVSGAKSVSVKELWSLKPTGLKAAQIMNSADFTEEEYAQVEMGEGLVRLTWNAGSNPNMTGGFAIFVGGVQVPDEDVVYTKYVDIGASGLNTAIIKNQKAASNKYTVKPMNGDVQGIASAAVTAKVVELWKVAPEITTVRQYSANEVEVVWKAGSELQDLFVVYDTVGKTTTEVWTTEALSKDADYEYSAIIENVEGGAHKYTVKAYTYVDGKAVEGSVSNAVTLNVSEADWASEPWITDIYQNAIGEVTIQWDHVTKAESYIVYELIGTEFVPFEPTSEMSLTVPVTASGMHTYAVRPQMADPENEGKMLAGAMSKAESAYLHAAADAKLTGFTVVQNGFKAELSWNAHELAIDYTVTMTDVKAGGSVTAKTGGATSYTFTVPAAGVYDFEVTPVFGENNNGQAAVKRGVEFGEAVELTAVFDPVKDGVVLTWTASTAGSVSGYRIYRQGPDDEEMEVLASGSFANLTYTDTAVYMGETYTYAVGAYRASGEDVLSAAKTVTPQMPEIAPATGLTGRHLGQGIELSWTASADADKYDVYYEVWEESVGYADELVAVTDDTKVSIYLDEANTAHSYYVIACAELGYHLISAQCDAITVNPVEAAQIAAKFNPTTGNVELSWNAVAGNPEYYLEKKAGSGDWQTVGKMEGTSYVDTDVAMGNTYGYRLITKHAAGYAVSETSIQLKQLGRVTGFETWFFNTFVELMWDDMVTVSGYEIQRSDDNGATYTTIATLTEEEYKTNMARPIESAYTDEVPALGAKYMYRVRAMIGDKAGAWSAVGTADIGLPPVVKEVYYSHKSGGVVLEWEKYEGANGYNIMRDGRFIIDDLIPADVTRFVDSDVEQGVTYRYDVDVLVDGGEISCEKTYEVTPDVLPKVGVADTYYFNENTEITLVLPENAASEYTYVVKENGELLESKVVVEDDAWKIVFDAADLNDHTYTVHVGVVMDNGSVMTGEGTTVTIDRGELWKLKDITDDEYGVHLYWDTQSTMPKKLFVMSYDVTDKDNHINRGGMDADAASGTYLDAEVAGSGKTLDYWLEAIYEDGVLSSELLSDCEDLLPYTVKSTFFAYEVNADKKTATITGYNGSKLDNMVIPETVDGYAVTAIAERAFAGVALTGELVIPANIKKVGFGAFNMCKKLTSVVIEGADTVFEDAVFRACYDGKTQTGLESITLPEGMTTIPVLFAESTKTLKSVNIPDSVTSIGDGAFSNTGLTGKLVLPSGLTALGKGAFGHTGYTEAEIYNKNLTEEMITDAFDYHWDGDTDDVVPSTELNLTKIYGYFGSGAYYYSVAKGIEFVGIGVTDGGVRYDVLADGTAVVMGTETVSGDVVIPATVDGIKVTKIGKDAFKGKTAITSVTISDGVIEICESAFEGCTGMTSATLPDSVEIIGVRAFANCTSLSSMTAN